MGIAMTSSRTTRRAGCMHAVLSGRTLDAAWRAALMLECELRIECMTLPTSAAEPVLSSDSDRATISLAACLRAPLTSRGRGRAPVGGLIGCIAAGSIRLLGCGRVSLSLVGHARRTWTRSSESDGSVDAASIPNSLVLARSLAPSRFTAEWVSDRIRTCHIRVTNSML